MKIKRILLTGDDGYNSIGTRILIHYLKSKYELSIAGTKTQQSAVGGMLHLKGEIRWEEIKVDGIKGVSIHGSPCDAIEFAEGYFEKPFDLVISGVNFGPNVAATIISSGTYSAAVRALSVKLAHRALVLSWFAPTDHILMDHHESHDIESYLDYPGKAVEMIVEKAVKENFWNSKLVNVNFPKEKSTKIKFTEPLYDSTKFIQYPVNINYQKKTFTYPYDFVKKQVSTKYDIGALNEQYISITL